MRRLFDLDDGLPDRESCRVVLSKRFELLSGAIVKSWDEWSGLPSDSRAKVTAMTRANVVHNFIEDHTKGLLSHDQGIEVANLPFFAVIADADVCLRFKKLNQDYLAIPNSPMGRLYYKNARIDGLGSHLKRLTCGYVLDRWGQELLDVAITCQENDRVVWTMSILDQVLPDGQNSTATPPFGFD